MALRFDIEQFESESIENQLGTYWMRVSDQITLVNRMVFLEWASARVIAGWVPAASEFEWKQQMTYYMWQNMTIADKLKTRKEELSGNSKILIPSAGFEQLVQNAARADGFPAFLGGWFLELTKGAVEAYERYAEALDPIFDAPTLEILNEVIPKKRAQVAWANGLVHDMVKDREVLASVERWRHYVRAYTRHIGGVDVRLEADGKPQPVCPVQEAYGPAPKKRSRPAWLKVQEGFEPPEEVVDNLKIFMWHYMTEIQVCDPMCYIFYGMDDMPFEFYVDFSRHIWDEVRHHLMGVRRLRQMGYNIHDFPIPYGEDATQELENYYTELTMIGETCSFTRKKKSLEAYYAKGDILSGMTAEIDIVDERMHVRFGKKWIPVIYKTKFNDSRTLDEIVRSVMDRWMNLDDTGLGKHQGNPELAKLTSGERKSITHFAFCGKIEFKNLNFEKL
ncbi:DUF455 family protein [Paenibacillus koleovorans]|uniref:DUF455 family protein n=1 Tax=Paenibacillus koleovorans TaxID=121608 RepID=UPI000FDA266A|nr:DUF455 family protein [Paenibacillus koleovorans]